MEALDISAGTVCRIKRRYLEGGLSRALEENPRPGHPAKLDERGEAHLIALACSEAPQGHDHWTLRLLANKVVELGIVPCMSREGILKRLKRQSQAVAEEGVVYSPGERRVCGLYGGCAGPLRGTL